MTDCIEQIQQTDGDTEGEIVIEVEPQKRLNIGPRWAPRRRRRFDEPTPIETPGAISRSNARWLGGVSAKRRDRLSLSIRRVLWLADRYHDHYGKWPKTVSGRVDFGSGFTWQAVDRWLRDGSRGLPGGISLADLLAEHRGARKRAMASDFDVESILAKADSYYKKHAKWPKFNSGPVSGWPGETWQKVNSALSKGIRGLHGGSTLTQLLYERRGADMFAWAPRLTYDKILAWVDSHYAFTNKWPHDRDGEIADAPSETWLGVNFAMVRGTRGLEPGLSLAALLQQKRGIRSKRYAPGLNTETILKWADAYYERTGKWPVSNSGGLVESPDDSWNAPYPLRFKRAIGVYQADLPSANCLLPNVESEIGSIFPSFLSRLCIAG